MTPTPLVKKLGLKDGMRAKFINAPNEYFDWLGEPFPEFEIAENELDFVHIFTNSEKELEVTLSTLGSILKPKGMIWVSWFKKAAKKESELSGNVIREKMRGKNFIDAKVCSISDDWSALKFIYQKR